MRGQGREGAIPVGQRTRGERGFVRENVRSCVQADRDDAESQSHALARAHPHAVQGTHPGGQPVRGVGLVGRKAQRSQGASTHQRVRADPQRATQVVAAPARHGNEDRVGLVTPARHRAQVPVPAQSRDEGSGRDLAGNRRRVVAGRRQANRDLPATAAQDAHDARPQAHAAPARRHRRDEQQNAAAHARCGHDLRRPGSARERPAGGACA